MTPHLLVVDRDADPTHGDRISYCFRGEHRLHVAAEFNLVFASRRVFRGKNFDLHYRPMATTSASRPVSARLGLVIAKKLARSAVQRNMLKRLAREVFRHVRSRLPAYDLVLRLSSYSGAEMDAEKRRLLSADVKQLLMRLPQCRNC